MAAVSFMDLTNLIFFSKGLTLGFQFSNDFGRISHSSGAKKKKKKKRKPKRATLRRSRFIVNLFLRSHVFSWWSFFTKTTFLQINISSNVKVYTYKFYSFTLLSLCYFRGFKIRNLTINILMSYIDSNEHWS